MLALSPSSHRKAKVRWENTTEHQVDILLTEPTVVQRITRFLDENSVPNLSGKIRIVKRVTSEVGLPDSEAYKATIEETGEKTLIINLQVRHLSLRNDEAYLLVSYFGD